MEQWDALTAGKGLGRGGGWGGAQDGSSPECGGGPPGPRKPHGFRNKRAKTGREAEVGGASPWGPLPTSLFHLS